MKDYWLAFDSCTCIPLWDTSLEGPPGFDFLGCAFTPAGLDVAPQGLEKASFDVSPGPGADAPRL
jgi:hypothetical protein